MRERGEEIPTEIRAKLRELYQSGALQRPAGGGRRGEGGGVRPRPAQSTTRTIYLLAKDSAGEPALQPVRVKTGISDGITTEILDGLKENDVVVTGVKSTAPAAAPAGSSPFGGPPGGGMRRF
jgi:HlyD family secretion protein